QAGPAVQRDLVRDQHHGQFELPEAAQVDEHVGDEHGHGAVGEVDHASAAGLEDEPLAEDGVGGAGAEPEDQEEEVAGHGVSGVWSVRVAAAGPALLASGGRPPEPPEALEAGPAALSAAEAW